MSSIRPAVRPMRAVCQRTVMATRATQTPTIALSLRPARLRLGSCSARPAAPRAFHTTLASRTDVPGGVVQGGAAKGDTVEAASNAEGGGGQPVGREALDRIEAQNAYDALLEAAAVSMDARSESGALTLEQEEALILTGRIPPVATGNAAMDALAAARSGETPLPVTETATTATTTKTAPETDGARAGHKFPLPERSLPVGSHLKARYHPVLMQVTRLLMRDGKLSQAQRHMATVLNILRTSPPPKLSTKFPLLPGTPPAAHLPLNPVLYLTIAMDSVAPLIRILKLKGAAGGGVALDIPQPLGVRQRRRVAFQWILSVVEKKPSKGSGKAQFGTRLAEEIIAVVEGRSGVWDRRQILHKQGTAARANLNSIRRRR